jgi:3-dehydroquinate synthase
MRTVEVALGERSYQVLIENGLLDRVGEHLKMVSRDRPLVIVSDSLVLKRQGRRLLGSLREVGFDLRLITLRPGERSKSWDALALATKGLAGNGVERGDHIIAFGGGVVGDLAGFAASVFKRGCNFIQVPTTLLAQVDSSVGGKTAINIPAGKNLIGTFHQPARVLIDPTTLDTLVKQQLRAGYAEVVKCGLIGDADFFAWCEANGQRLLEGDGAAREHAIEKSVAFKAAIVAEDECETSGRRALLNLGHTFGHALEAETGFSDTLLHGEAVALGMVLAFRFSAEKGLCSHADADRVAAHLAAVGLPTHLNVGTGASLAQHMAHDKKASGGQIHFILARGIGRAYVDRSVALDEVAAFLDRQRLTAPAVTA